MKVDANIFWARARAVSEVLSKGREDEASSLFGQDGLVVWCDKNPPDDQVDEEYTEASKMSLFLMDGFEFPETLFVFLNPSLLLISCSAKKIKLLEECKLKTPSGFTFHLVERGGKDENVSGTMERIFLALGITSAAQWTGWVHNQSKPFGTQLLTELSSRAVNFSGNRRSAVEEAILLTPRDSSAKKSLELACQQFVTVHNKFRKDIGDYEDHPRSQEEEGKRVMSKLADEKLDIEPVESLCRITSGLEPHDQQHGNKKKLVETNVISLEMGVQCKSQLASFSRTLFVDPTEEDKQAYALLLSVRSMLISEMKPGRRLSDVFSACQRVWEESTQFARYFAPTTTLGHAVGTVSVEIDASVEISAQNARRIPEHSSWVIDLHVKDLPRNNKNEFVSIRISDVILVRTEGTEVLTAGAKPEWKSVHFRTLDEDEEEEKPSKKSAAAVVETVASRSRSTRRGGGGEQEALMAEKKSHEVEMGERQYARMMRKREAALQQSRSRDDSEQHPSSSHDTLCKAYASPRELPLSEQMKRDRVHVDTKREAVLLPIGDRLIPFHISTIKTVSKVDESGGDAATIRFNFHFPASAAKSTQAMLKDMPPEMSAALELYPQLTYIKELSFKSRDVDGVVKLVQRVRELAKFAKEMHKREADESNLVEQAELILLKERSKEKPATLVDVSMFPSASVRGGQMRSMGRLRAHVNGFRFQAEKQQEVDILYANIKYFFFMRGDRELKVCVHFYLKNAIMVGKKKTIHVQFFTEVLEASSDLAGGGRNQHGSYDPDEIEDEDRQRRLVSKLNKTFSSFCSQSVEIATEHGYQIGNGDVEVVNTDSQRQKGWSGMPNKEMVWIQPTMHCLVNLSEKEPFVLPVEEIEHIHLQRLSIGRIKTFDMIFILKSQIKLDRSGDAIKVAKIESIPIDRLDQVRAWIDSHDELTYTAGEATLKYDVVLDGVRWELDQGIFWEDKDKEGTPKDIGWLFLNPQGIESEDSDEDEDDSEFSGSGDSDDDGSEEDEEDSSAIESEVSEGGESDDGGDDDDEDDEGEDWDELDRKAEAMDKAGKHRHDENDTKPPKKKHRSH